MTYIVSIDPGVSSGIAVGQYSATDALVVVNRFQISGGLSGLLPDLENMSPIIPGTLVICEKFTPRSGNGFSHTTKSVEPLRCEGALIALGLMPDYPDPRWRQPTAQYFSGGETPAARKKASRAFLKKHDLYLTGKDVGQRDADDAISATLHLFGYMRQIKHRPTLERYFKED